MSEPARNYGTGTRDRILDAAEVLFIQYGFSATSLRAIANEAEVNLAATHYHFGSKFGLLAEVFHRRVGPVDQARRHALVALQAKTAHPDVRGIVQAFLSPFYEVDEEFLRVAPALIGSIHAEPEAISKPLLEGEFADLTQLYITALSQAMPQVSEADMRWRFHFMVGAMLQLVRYMTPLGSTQPNEDFADSLDRLVDFVVGGICQGQESAI